MAKKDRWITTIEAAEIIGILPHTLATYRALNKANGKSLGPYYRKKNRRVIYSQKAVEAYRDRRDEDDKITGGVPA